MIANRYWLTVLHLYKIRTVFYAESNVAKITKSTHYTPNIRHQKEQQNVPSSAKFNAQYN